MSDKNPLTLLPGVWKSITLLFNLTNQIVNERLADELRREGFDITPRDGWILMAAEEKPMSQRMIAAVLNINTNVMVRLVDELEKKGLLRRVPGPTRRENNLELTNAGKALLKKIYADWEGRTERIYQPVPLKYVRQYADHARRIVTDHYKTKKTAPQRRLARL